MKGKEYHIPANLQQRITAEQAMHYRIVPIAMDNDSLVLKTDAESLDNLLHELGIVLSERISLESCESHELDKYLSTNYRINTNKQTAQLGYSNDFLEKLLIEAKSLGSSDIHIEPYKENCRIRFRLDGKLVERYSLPLEEYPSMVNKIKIQARLDIAEKRLPQDGRMTLRSQKSEFDMRISSMPTLHGEKLVLRILSKDAGAIDLEKLGFEDQELSNYLKYVGKPNGIILISGPTGSGKTTTLYATLKELNNEGTNILTIEDPIEYTLEGINQVQLKESIGLDFSSALRTFLRQDPDIIMVGEIRDVKTANMAIRAALTGHMVLSTIHTNSAWATISRLIDMGVPPFLIASTLNMSVAQRLLRKLCDHCKEELDAHSGLPEGITVPKDIDKHYVPKGCLECHFTGYQGRQAIYEILPINNKLYSHIKNNSLQIEDYLKKNRIKTLKDNALQMVRSGTTSLEEAYPFLLD